jgi:hypothetical protein
MGQPLTDEALDVIFFRKARTHVAWLPKPGLQRLGEAESSQPAARVCKFV